MPAAALAAGEPTSSAVLASTWPEDRVGRAHANGAIAAAGRVQAGAVRRRWHGLPPLSRLAPEVDETAGGVGAVYCKE